MLSTRKLHRVVAAIVVATAVGAVYGPWVSVALGAVPRLLAQQTDLASLLAEFRSSQIWLYVVGAVFGVVVGLVIIRRIDNIEQRSQVGIGATLGCAASGIGLIVLMCVCLVVAGFHTATNGTWIQCLITLLFIPIIFSIIAAFVALPFGLFGGIIIALISWPVLRIVTSFLPTPPAITTQQQNPVPDKTS